MVEGSEVSDVSGSLAPEQGFLPCGALESVRDWRRGKTARVYRGSAVGFPSPHCREMSKGPSVMPQSNGGI